MPQKHVAQNVMELYRDVFHRELSQQEFLELAEDMQRSMDEVYRTNLTPVQ